MAVIYRTTGAWGAGKGSNLTAVEVDGNFYDHELRIDALEDSRPQPDNIASVATAGTLMTFYLQSGTSLGPVTLPTLVWQDRDEWLPFTLYAALDVVSVSGQGLFLVKISHTSAATFDPNLSAGSPPAAVYQQLIGVGTNASIDDLNNVAITGAVDGDFIAWNNGTSQWTNRSKTAATALLDALAGDAGAGGTKGLVPAPAAGDAAAGKILSASGDWEPIADLLSTWSVYSVRNGSGERPTSTTTAGYAITSNYAGGSTVDFWNTVNSVTGAEGFNWYQKTGAASEARLLHVYGDGTYASVDFFSGGAVRAFLYGDAAEASFGGYSGIPFKIYTDNLVAVTFDTSQRATFEKLIRIVGQTVASLPAAGTIGRVACVTDSNTATWGATVAGGGAIECLAFDNGTNWTVFAV